MKQFLAVSVLAALITVISPSPSVFALPDKSINEITQWVKNHDFLSTWLQDVKAVGNYHFIAFRELQDHWFLDVFMYPYENKLDSVELVLVKKEYSNQEPEERQDQRKWVNVECKSIWSRENETAYTLLLKTYGKAIADDFKYSRQTFNGPVFYHPIFFDYFEGKIDEGQDGKKIPVNNTKMRLEKLELYMGKFFTYETFPSDCQRLTIRSLKWGRHASDAHNHNLKIYLKLKQQKDARDKPADIEIK